MLATSDLVSRRPQYKLTEMLSSFMQVTQNFEWTLYVNCNMFILNDSL